ncbi:putative acyl- n-acyltransferase protein [Botrytis fragariae]|uniref:Putative acyl- n-acyltransferase protein n=1 Tax=Botrytis fragariae TaxID=1964551 RepID=A0A8H6B404_9HELO|nr:putative acyl- n-acyltransferase protein [Botrytis fragariae]KAF5879038.1 putative acyl- n-acyltransferase protein [Botrytis fragariae]
MADPIFHLTTPHLFIGYFDANNPIHCTFLVTLYNTPEFIAAEGKTAIISPEAARERIATRFVEEHARNGYGQFLVYLRSDSDPSFSAAIPIGSVCLTKGNNPDSFDLPDVGFALVSEVHGRGYATEAARALLEYVKKEQGLENYFGFTSSGNAASMRVMKKLGMVDLGVQPFQGEETHVFASPGIEDLEKYGFKK